MAKRKMNQANLPVKRELTDELVDRIIHAFQSGYSAKDVAVGLGISLYDAEACFDVYKQEKCSLVEKKREEFDKDCFYNLMSLKDKALSLYHNSDENDVKAQSLRILLSIDKELRGFKDSIENRKEIRKDSSDKDSVAKWSPKLKDALLEFLLFDHNKVGDSSITGALADPTPIKD